MTSGRTARLGTMRSTIPRWTRRLFASSGHKRQKQTGSSPVGLLDLPVELLLDIVDHLDVGDAVCLSLCNKALRHASAATSWRTLNSPLLRNTKGGLPQLTLHYQRSDEETTMRRDFLIRIGRDCPRQFYCYTCSYLHPISSVMPTDHFQPQPYLQCAVDEDISESPYCCFETHHAKLAHCFFFQHVQLAMMHHRQGSPYGIRPASLDVLEVHKAELRAESTSLLSIEAKVIDGELNMRVQLWATFTTVVPIHWPRWNALPYVTPGPDWLSCDKCCTEFEAEIRHLDMETEAIVITKWLNFGTGRDPQDPQWRCNLYGNGMGMIQKGRPRIGNRAVFEVVAERSCEVLTDDNAYVLERERFGWLFQRSESGRQVWTYANTLEDLLNQMEPSTNNTTAERLTLLGLPAELRNRIFALAVVAQEPLVARLAVLYTPGGTPEQAMTRKTRAMPEITAATQVNKQIRREILPIFYGPNHFLIPKDYFNKQTGASWLKAFFTDIAKEHVKTVRYAFDLAQHPDRKSRRPAGGPSRPTEIMITSAEEGGGLRMIVRGEVAQSCLCIVYTNLQSMATHRDLNLLLTRLMGLDDNLDPNAAVEELDNINTGGWGLRIWSGCGKTRSVPGSYEHFG
ncbi:hypothetical protein LTR56_003824 [Elasticomyces elasticus]|nr:hypothetical protein LTR22_013115 [Elasticomyces elasticus]KAK3654966.1 hypothetical protein LTR56_003824 [Elasticomyces elasticus]KAK4928702.1 hypothetical protein LTR49_004511 [Elasticomyces elasticus]KAK5766670.1 hypothetical protein LTS12_003289 [Elasticomyces elasticus]